MWRLFDVRFADGDVSSVDLATGKPFGGDSAGQRPGAFTQKRPSAESRAGLTGAVGLVNSDAFCLAPQIEIQRILICGTVCWTNKRRMAPEAYRVQREKEIPASTSTSSQSSSAGQAAVFGASSLFNAAVFGSRCWYRRVSNQTERRIGVPSHRVLDLAPPEMPKRSKPRPEATSESTTTSKDVRVRLVEFVVPEARQWGRRANTAGAIDFTTAESKPQLP